MMHSPVFNEWVRAGDGEQHVKHVDSEVSRPESYDRRWGSAVSVAWDNTNLQ